MSNASKWNQRYAQSDWQVEQLQQPCFVLKEYSSLLPKSGKALDLACGLGGNALYLAKQGLETDAFDIAEQAINRLAKQAAYFNLNINMDVRDLNKVALSEHSYDVIVVSYFLQREWFASIINALKPNGLLFYQTFIQTENITNGPKNKNFRLARNELIHLCSQLLLLVYIAEPETGVLSADLTQQAILVARKT